MTQLPPVPRTIQFTLFYNDQGNANVRNLLYFTYSGSVSNTDMVTLCNNVMTSWASQFASEVVPGCSLIGVVGNDLASDLGAKAASTHAAVPGTNGGSPVPNGVALVVSNESSRKYRGGHSRNYVPGMTRNNLSDGNTWSTTAQAALAAAWGAFIQNIVQQSVPAAVGALVHVVAHRYGRSATAPVLSADTDTPSVPLANPFTDPITSIVINPQIGSQRRRNQQSG